MNLKTRPKIVYSQYHHGYVAKTIEDKMFNPKFIEDWLERFEKQERRRLTNATVLNNQVNPAYEVKWLQGYITAKQETLEATVDVLPLIFQHEFERFKEILEE